MKNLITLLFTILISSSWSQSILFVDDNDLLPENSDTVTTAIQGTIYSAFDYYNVADSGSTPDINLLSAYDLVIWYSSTDGAGLGFWNAGSTGNLALIDYLVNNGRLWVIGSDLLYAGLYSTPATFSSGDFAYDYLGLQSYNVQSYADDGSTGVPQVDLITGAPTYFPDSLGWIFPTGWYFDGVTARSGSTNLYEMGPSSYTLYQEVSMFHYKDLETNTLSTYFDPALISNYGLRKDFMQNSIFYMLNFDLGISKNIIADFTVHPNPVDDQLFLKVKNSSTGVYKITSTTGTKVQNGVLSNSTIDVKNLESGLYFLTIDGNTQQIMKL